MFRGSRRGQLSGYTFGRGNVKPLSILTWPQPQTKKQVSTFLGLVGYYPYIHPWFCHKSSPPKRTDPQVPPKPGEVDQRRRAEVGIGAMLSQVHDGMEHPVMYVCRKLLLLESLAVKWDIEKFVGILLGYSSSPLSPFQTD